MTCTHIRQRIERIEDELARISIRYDQDPTDEYLDERTHDLLERLQSLREELDECEDEEDEIEA